MPMVTLASTLLASPALAADITIELPGGDQPTSEQIEYVCEGRRISATYINAGSNALAVIDLGDQTVVMANVLAGSGAKYAGQQFVWWTKGPEASLYDLTQGEDSAPVAACRQAR
ncbi:MliC family protein [Mesorhizobium sp. LHD-90]|nr:MliC family protein [Mesorhizobium sp. LHD-90]MDQ6436198.1 MliC family protein [Mesorhizobium sp. LHD-90]